MSHAMLWAGGGPDLLDDDSGVPMSPEETAVTETLMGFVRDDDHRSLSRALSDDPSCLALPCFLSGSHEHNPLLLSIWIGSESCLATFLRETDCHLWDFKPMGTTLPHHAAAYGSSWAFEPIARAGADMYAAMSSSVAMRDAISICAMSGNQSLLEEFIAVAPPGRNELARMNARTCPPVIHAFDSWLEAMRAGNRTLADGVSLCVSTLLGLGVSPVGPDGDNLMALSVLCRNDPPEFRAEALSFLESFGGLCFPPLMESLMPSVLDRPPPYSPWNHAAISMNGTTWDFLSSFLPPPTMPEERHAVIDMWRMAVSLSEGGQHGNRLPDRANMEWMDAMSEKHGLGVRWGMLLSSDAKGSGHKRTLSAIAEALAISGLESLENTPNAKTKPRL